MNQAARDALAVQSTQDRLRQIGMLPVGSSRADFARYVTEQRELLRRLTREANVTLD
jgi:tripartite-type tricarboxylate transporter receptor subunit TctC